MNDNQKLMNKKLDEKVELLNKTMDDKIEMLRVDLNRDLVDKKQHNEVNIEANANKNIEPENKFDDFQEQMEADSKAADIIARDGVPYVTGENHQLLYTRKYRPLLVSVLLFC
jgi:post-segregation antitoxin (ccd killing protein)